MFEVAASEPFTATPPGTQARLTTSPRSTAGLQPLTLEEIAAYREARGDAGTLGNHKRRHIARRRWEKDCEHCQKGRVALLSLSDRSQRRFGIANAPDHRSDSPSPREQPAAARGQNYPPRHWVTSHP